MCPILQIQRDQPLIGGSDMSYTVLLCGVGGQGTILAAHILAEVAGLSGKDVKVSEIHGMSQRGGAVTTVVVFGDEVHSMVSGIGCADAIVAFEMIEALRNISDLKLGGTLIASNEIIKPSSVLTGSFELNPNIQEELISKGAILVPAQANAREAGSVKASNVVLLGALAEELDFSEQNWIDAISAHVPQKTIDINLAAFEAGRTFAREHKE